MSRRSEYLRALGPGLLWAATAIGVSHLVQSTRAGAGYGFVLAPLIVLAVVLKYPFFEAGPRYAVATGESLLEGYAALGRWAVGLYLLLTVGTMFTVVAAVTLVTSALAAALFGLFSLGGWATLLLAVSAGILVLGRFPLLDSIVKVIIVVLTLSTLGAFVVAVISHRAAAPVPADQELVWGGATVAFLVALLGWMPAGIDMAAWHSLWTLARARQTGHTPRWREARLDFVIGYAGTCLIALIFLALGALVMRPSGVAFAASAAGFAAQLVEIYAATLGDWSRPLILVAGFTTMFSTTLAVSDGFPRVLARMYCLQAGDGRREAAVYRTALAALLLGALLLIGFFRQRFTLLIDLATTISFLTAPIIGYLNYRVLTGRQVAEMLRPSPAWRALAWAGLVFLSGLGVLYLLWRLLPDA